MTGTHKGFFRHKSDDSRGGEIGRHIGLKKHRALKSSSEDCDASVKPSAGGLRRWYAALLILGAILGTTPNLLPVAFAGEYHSPLDSNAILFFRNPETNTDVSYKTNSHGWKDSEHEFQKHNKRILIIGDSITFDQVPIDRQYSKVLENLTGIEVISIAIPGWSIKQKLQAWEKEGYKYHPNLVIYQSHVSDFFDEFDTKQPRDGIPMLEQVLVKFESEVGRNRFAVFCAPYRNPAAFPFDGCAELRKISQKHGIQMIVTRSNFSGYSNFHPNIKGSQEIAADIALFVKWFFANEANGKWICPSNHGTRIRMRH